MVRTKVFVGNLSFNTKENELAKEFEVAGKVASANIITRGPRSLGYGFVEMESEQEAENAVKLLHKKEVDGRPINVEVAKPREEIPANTQQQQSTEGGEFSTAGRGRGGRGRGGRGGASRGRGGFRRFRRRDGSDDEGEGDQQQQGQQQTQGQQQGSDNQGSARGGRGRGRGGVSRGRGGARPPRNDNQPDTRTPSKTTLFIANLPFAFDDDAFTKVFKDDQLAVKAAHVVKKRSGRSKGFGFAEFENEGDQQKALTALNNKSVEGRELVVKVALTESITANATDTKDQSTTNNATPAADVKPATIKTETK